MGADSFGKTNDCADKKQQPYPQFANDKLSEQARIAPVNPGNHDSRKGNGLGVSESPSIIVLAAEFKQVQGTPNIGLVIGSRLVGSHRLHRTASRLATSRCRRDRLSNSDGCRVFGTYCGRIVSGCRGQI
jgi:hypothetical protein